MGVLIAQEQVETAKTIAGMGWEAPIKVPNSQELVLLVGRG